MSAKSNQFFPDYAIAPGEIIKEYLEAFRMTPADLVQRTGLPVETVGDLLRARLPITAKIASALERVFGRPARFWLNMEQLFQEDSARLAADKGGGQ